LLEPIISRKAAKKNKLFCLLRGIFGYILIPNKINIRGLTMYLYKSGHSFELACENGYERCETDFLEKLNLKNKIVIDIGACIGYYSLLLSKRVGSHGKVLAFEPDKENFYMLQKNIAENNSNNITGFQLAVGNKYTKTYLKKEKSPGQHYISNNPNNAHQVSMVDLDNFIESYGLSLQDVGYVKIDTEGCEYKILLGMKKIIENARHLVIQFEYDPSLLNKQGSKPTDLVDLIKQFHMKVYYWDLRNNKLLECTNPNWLKEENVAKEFRKGLIYSRNILLMKN